MTYAPADRAFYDADSHIMELPDFITAYADPAIREELKPVSYSASIVTDAEVAEIVANGNRHSDAHVSAQIALGDELIAKSKEIQALGAFTASDRTTALDMLGFKKQLVFATHSVVQPFHPSKNYPQRLRYGATRAHNRHMLEFCAADARLMPVCVVPLDVPERAIEEAQWAIEQGAAAIWVPHRAPLGHAPGHVDLEGFWARLAEADVPFVLHVGGAPLQALGDWTNNGRAATRDWMGGGENVRTKDATIMHQWAETFVSMLLVDGVLARHPRLRGAAVELGAGWVPELARRLDSIARIYSRVDESMRFEIPPSEQLRTQMGFTPFPHEDVGRLIRDSAPELYLFSSDYPHIEGGRDPIGKFEGHLGDASDAVRSAFYCENFLRLFPTAA
ncbi:MAG: amidohydrolase family protein [Pseudomonadota bacterium]